MKFRARAIKSLRRLRARTSPRLSKGDDLTKVAAGNEVIGKNGNVRFGFDTEKQLFFARDVHSDRKVYVSARERLALYRKGTAHRKNRLLSDYRIPPNLVRPQDMVIDVGANSGELGIWVLSSGGQYAAFEPDPDAFRALQNNVSSPSLFAVALGDSNGIAEFYLSTEEGGSSLFRPQTFSEEISVEQKTLAGC